MKWLDYIPLLEQLKGYSRKVFNGDLIAALTVCIILIPQGMAYALLAGLPPIYGLYGGLLPLFVYGVLGTSRQLSVGPVAISSLLIFAGVSQLAEPESDVYIQLVIFTGLLVGIGQLALGALRLGFLVNFLSQPVIMGFTSAAAIIIAISQLKYLLGFPIPRFDKSLDTLRYTFEHLGDLHWLSFGFCVGAIVLMLLLKRVSKSIPAALVVSILGGLATAIWQLDDLGLAIVGEVPDGLPAFQVPEWTLENFKMLWPTVLTVTVMGVVESISIAKALELKNEDTQVRPNQELFAIGAAKLAGAFFQAIPSSASFTRSAVNNEAGAKTGVASIITSIVIALVLVFLTPLFYFLPKAILGAIVLMAVRGLFEVKRAAGLLKVSRRDFMMLLITFVVTLVLGIEEGVMTGVVLSLMLVIYQASKPHIAILGRLPNTRSFRNIERFSDAIQYDDILILRFDAPLFFLNVEHFKDSVFDAIHQHRGALKYFILDGTSIGEIDSGGLNAVEVVHKRLAGQGIQLYLTGLIGPVRDRFYRSGLAERIGQKHHFLYVSDAVAYLHKADSGQQELWSEYALQNKFKG